MLKLYLYPMVVLKDEFEDENFVAMIPDLGISTNGKNVEEAYLYCKDYLRVYIENALSYDLDFNLPSEIGKVANKYKNCQVMLVDTVVETKRFGSADWLQRLTKNNLFFVFCHVKSFLLWREDDNRRRISFRSKKN